MVGWGVPWPGLDGEGIPRVSPQPGLDGWGGTWGTLGPGLDGGGGYPAYPPARSGWWGGIPGVWLMDGVPLTMTGWGTPMTGWGTPHHEWMGYPPYHEWMGYPGYPPGQVWMVEGTWGTLGPGVDGGGGYPV